MTVVCRDWYMFNARLTELGIPNATVYGRVKHPYSIYRKMYAQEKTMEEVYDLFAFRVLVDTVADCYNGGQVHHVSPGGEDEDLLREEVHLQGVDELLRVRVLLVLQEAADSTTATWWRSTPPSPPRAPAGTG